MGLDFFRKVVQLEQKYAGTKQIQNDLQTNGVLLDDEWCKSLKERGSRTIIGSIGKEQQTRPYFLPAILTQYTVSATRDKAPRFATHRD